MLKGEEGFSLLELMVALAIIVIMTAVIALETLPQLPSARAASLSKSLDALKQAAQNFQMNVGAYPGNLHQLVVPLGQLGTPLDVCGGAIPQGGINGWRGPYLLQNVTSAGIPVGASTIASELSWIGAGAGGSAQLRIRVTEVDRAVAEVLEEHLDAPDFDFSAGNILWTESPTGSERGVLLYSFPFSGCF